MLPRTMLVACLAAVSLTFTPTARAGDANDALAKKAVEQFLKGYKASDIDAIMAAVEVPWFHNAKEVIKDREQLKREFQKDLARDKNRAELQHKITDCLAYHAVRAKLREEERKLADEVLQDDDRVLLLRLGKDVRGEQGDKVVFLVRIREGKARVVGLKD